jgi:sulfide:quinone oxidoreductase
MKVKMGGQQGLRYQGLRYSVVIVGAGAAGIATAASLKARKDDLEIALIDPADVHYYQPGWTLVGAGTFEQAQTVRPLASVIPSGVKWLKEAVTVFDPDNKLVVLRDGQTVGYDKLIVAPGLKLNWSGIEGLQDTLGRNGVTSNYRFDLAPYTWKLVSALRGGRALFTQPPLPIKCAGAPQKALYLSADYWRRQGCLAQIEIEFFNAGASLFGVKDYVPALMEYIDLYRANLKFNHNLVRVDGPGRRAWFAAKLDDGTQSVVETTFDMIHVVPPQEAPDFIRASPLVDSGGWVDVDQASLRHKRWPDIYALGDACNTPNAKTAAAARKQAPIVAHNLLHDMGFIKDPLAAYDGYGSCPLTVERGKVVLAEFGYGGKLLPSFPTWFIDGKKPSRKAWQLKERILPVLYWNGMLRGREWLAKPPSA